MAAKTNFLLWSKTLFTHPNGNKIHDQHDGPAVQRTQHST